MHVYGSNLWCVSLALVLLATAQAQKPRNVRISGRNFVLSQTGAPIILAGPNVVVKGPPYLPAVQGQTICRDTPADPGPACIANPSACESCTTFNQADVDHIKAQGWNTIRLGVVWAGAQPQDVDSLDAAFLQRFHAILNLTDANNLNVILDNHGDMVGSAGCGNGVPMWVQQKAAPDLIGKPLETGALYKLVPGLDVQKLVGYGHCSTDVAKWEAHAHDPNYNLLNGCCQAMNSGNPAALGFTTISQRTMDYVLQPGEGREAFVRYWALVAEAVREHPSAIAAELMNEPMSIRRRDMFDTWRACAEAINEVIPDMSVSVCDIGETSSMPAWVTKLTRGTELIAESTIQWMEEATTVFYSWHYGNLPQAIRNMEAISREWNMPTFATEVGCDLFDAASAAGISASYWHYSSYCNTGPWFGNRSVPEETFGACILGWASGNSSKCISRGLYARA